MTSEQILVGSVVAYPNGTPLMKRQDGWYVGDAKQPTLTDDALRAAVVLREGWTGCLT